jgi:hypothetical protein
MYLQEQSSNGHSYLDALNKTNAPQNYPPMPPLLSPRAPTHAANPMTMYGVGNPAMAHQSSLGVFRLYLLFL